MTRFRTAPPAITRDEQAFRDSEWEARPRWERGELVPACITQLLDACGLSGPGVDIACGAVEPAVDEWEAGERYPTWPQLLALARLVDAMPTFFFHPVPHIEGPVFICGRPRSKSSVYYPPKPINHYPPEVWQPVVAGLTDGLFDLPPSAYQPTARTTRRSTR